MAKKRIKKFRRFEKLQPIMNSIWETEPGMSQKEELCQAMKAEYERQKSEWQGEEGRNGEGAPESMKNLPTG